jgi:hypothetical protein
MGSVHSATEGMAPELAEIYQPLYDDVLTAHARWEVYRALFVERKETVDTLNAAAAGVFWAIQGPLFSSVLLSICRLTDPPGSNLTLLSLPHCMQSGCVSSFEARMGRKLTSLLDQVEPLRRQRNKREAHTDRKVRLKKIPLPGIRAIEIDAALESIADVLNEVCLDAGQPVVCYKDLGCNSDTRRFAKKLQKLVSELRQSRNVSPKP